MSIWGCGCDRIDHLLYEGSHPGGRLVTRLALQLDRSTMIQKMNASRQGVQDAWIGADKHGLWVCVVANADDADEQLDMPLVVEVWDGVNAYAIIPMRVYACT